MSPSNAPDASSFSAYTAALASGEVPVLGHLVMYSVVDAKMTPDDLAGTFTELGLDPKFLPGPVRPVDAYERVTGPTGPRTQYAVDDPLSTLPKHSRKKREIATLMVRHVRRDRRHVIRHIVREVRDERKVSLKYDVLLGQAVFTRDIGREEEGAGWLVIQSNEANIRDLQPAEQRRVHELIAAIEEEFDHRCTHVGGDRLRAVARDYLEHLGAIRVRPGGGVYFVHRQHADTLAALRQLVGTFSHKSRMDLIPILDHEEMREMVTSAFATGATDELDKLAIDLATAQREGAAPAVVKGLADRYTKLRDDTAHHSELLSTSLEDTEASLAMVQQQLAKLLTQDS